MLCFEKAESVVKYILLSFLCFDFVFATPTQIAYGLEDGKSEDIYGNDDGKDNYDEDNNIIQFDFFEFTTRKRYIWEDWTDPTTETDYDYSNSSSNFSFFLYVVCPLMGIGLTITLLWICIQAMKEHNCCSLESDSESSSDRFTTVHPPPPSRVHRPRTGGTPARVYRPPTGGTPAIVHRPPTGGTPVRLYRPSTVTDAGATISFINPTYASSRPDNTVGEKPPEYSAVTLSDLVNPTQPAFPVVHKESETPPPEYGKGDLFSNKLS